MSKKKQGKRDYQVLRDLIVDLESIDDMLLNLRREGFNARIFVGDDNDGTSVVLDKEHVRHILQEKRANLEGELDEELAV